MGNIIQTDHIQQSKTHPVTLLHQQLTIRNRKPHERRRTRPWREPELASVSANIINANNISDRISIFPVGPIMQTPQQYGRSVDQPKVIRPRRSLSSCPSNSSDVTALKTCASWRKGSGTFWCMTVNMLPLPVLVCLQETGCMGTSVSITSWYFIDPCWAVSLPHPLPLQAWS